MIWWMDLIGTLQNGGAGRGQGSLSPSLPVVCRREESFPGNPSRPNRNSHPGIENSGYERAMKGVQWRWKYGQGRGYLKGCCGLLSRVSKRQVCSPVLSGRQCARLHLAKYWAPSFISRCGVRVREAGRGKEKGQGRESMSVNTRVCPSLSFWRFSAWCVRQSQSEVTVILANPPRVLKILQSSTESMAYYAAFELQ